MLPQVCFENHILFKVPTLGVLSVLYPQDWSTSLTCPYLSKPPLLDSIPALMIQFFLSTRPWRHLQRLVDLGHHHTKRANGERRMQMR